MKRILCILILVLGLTSTMNAQRQGLYEINIFPVGKHAQKDDSSSISSAFKRGKFNGHIRYFFMATDNEKSLQIIMQMQSELG